jgi:helix-turn-helix, Psq domain
MKLWTEVRLDVRSGKLSMREACNKYKLNFRTIQKILNHEEPPGYRGGIYTSSLEGFR